MPSPRCRPSCRRRPCRLRLRPPLPPSRLTRFGRPRDIQNLTPSQRESLQRDWAAGLRFLEAHRDFLRDQVRRDRQRTWGKRLVRAVLLLEVGPLVALVVVVALLAAGIAI